jgi:hypothetical protein
MTRAVSVDTIKRGGKPRIRPSDAPCEGTKIRAYYDALRSGESVMMAGMFVPRLRDDFNMEIVSAGRNKGYRLIGEWIGQEFVTVDRL